MEKYSFTPSRIFSADKTRVSCVHVNSRLEVLVLVLWEDLWIWKQHRPLKRRQPTTTLHGVTTQKTSTWKVLSFGVKKQVWKLTYDNILHECHWKIYMGLFLVYTALY